MGVELYPLMVHDGDLSPDNIGEDVDQVCGEIWEACKGWGSDKKRLLKAVGAMSPEMRCKVAVRYPQLFEKELKEKLKAECGDKDFGTALQYMAVDPVTMECDMIADACKGMGTNETLLYTILCGRTNREMELLRKKFFDLKDKDLGRTLDSELGGNFENLIFNVLQGAEEDFDPDFHNDEKVQEDVAKFYAMGQGKFGTDEKGFFKLLAAAPTEHLEAVNLAYADAHGYTLVKAVEKEVGGDAGRATIFMLNMKLKPHVAVAQLINDACKGMGTNELLLTCTLIRYQPILKGVNQAHIELYGSTLQDRVKSEVRGNYEELLLEVIESADQN